MILAASPIHTGTINRTAVRFFPGPGEEPDLPWHAHEELLAALALPRTLRRVLKAGVLKHWRDHCRTVEVEEEPVLLAPHFVAQGLIGAAQEAGGAITTVPDLVEREYVREAQEALQALTAGMATVQERVAFALHAFRTQAGK